MTERILLLIVVVVLEIILGIQPKADRTTWFLENLPVFIILLCLLIFRVRFSLWTLRLMALHAGVLMLGGHYEHSTVANQRTRAGRYQSDQFFNQLGRAQLYPHCPIIPSVLKLIEDIAACSSLQAILGNRKPASRFLRAGT